MTYLPSPYLTHIGNNEKISYIFSGDWIRQRSCAFSDPGNSNIQSYRKRKSGKEYNRKGSVREMPTSKEKTVGRTDDALRLYVGQETNKLRYPAFDTMSEANASVKSRVICASR